MRQREPTREPTPGPTLEGTVPQVMWTLRALSATVPSMLRLTSRPLVGVLLLRVVEVVPDEDATVGAAVVAELAAWSCWFAQATTLAAYARA